MCASLHARQINIVLWYHNRVCGILHLFLGRDTTQLWAKAEVS